MLSSRALGLLIASAAFGCAGQKASVQPVSPAATANDVNRYLPLTDGVVFAYETGTEDGGERGVLMLRVRRQRANMAELGAGSRVQRLEIASDGIRHVTGGYLLKAPLGVGQRWRGQFGEVSVVATDRAISVPAGKFSGCVETQETASAPQQKQVKTVFCPDVGIVLLEAEGLVEGNLIHERASLRSFGPAVDLSVAVPD
jgi:hypothetical protein